LQHGAGFFHLAQGSVGEPQVAKKSSFLNPIFQPPCGIDPGVEDFAPFGLTGV